MRLHDCLLELKRNNASSGLCNRRRGMLENAHDGNEKGNGYLETRVIYYGLGTLHVQIV